MVSPGRGPCSRSWPDCARLLPRGSSGRPCRRARTYSHCLQSHVAAPQPQSRNIRGNRVAPLTMGARHATADDAAGSAGATTAAASPSVAVAERRFRSHGTSESVSRRRRERHRARAFVGSQVSPHIVTGRKVASLEEAVAGRLTSPAPEEATRARARGQPKPAASTFAASRPRREAARVASQSRRERGDGASAAARRRGGIFRRMASQPCGFPGALGLRRRW